MNNVFLRFVFSFLIIFLPATSLAGLDGDINNNGKVNLTDAVLALQIIEGLKPTSIYKEADLNGDEKIGLEEAVYAIQKVAGLRNHNPKLNFIGNKIINEASLFYFGVTGFDADYDPLTYSAFNLPDGASFNPNTKTFSWTPTYSQSGTYNITFTVIDIYGGSDSETITVIVNNKNRSPDIISIGNKSIDENSELYFTITGFDADYDPLTYSAFNLPDGASFNPNTKTFSWTPTYSQSGTYNITFTVIDIYGSSDSETITVIVNNKNLVFTAPEYFPLNVGNWWDFKNDNTGEVQRSQVAGTKLINGVMTYIYLYSTGNKDYFSSDSNGLINYGEYDISPDFTGDIFFTPPILYMPNNAQVGTTHVSNSNYSFNINGFTYHVNITSTSIILGVEDITTENSVLRNCIKASNQFTQYIQETGQTIIGDTTYYWFYKGIGVVKQLEKNLNLKIIRTNINGIESSY